MSTTAADTHVKLEANTNQALGIAQYAIDFLSDDPAKRGEPDASVLERTNMFFTDAVLCGLSALALKTNAPTILRDEALQYPVTDATPPLGQGDPTRRDRVRVQCASPAGKGDSGQWFGRA